MEILEVPFPALNKGQVLVRNYYSVISSGTEGKTVSDARKGYIAKARSRQKEVKQVINLIKTQGLKETYSMVMNKLDAPSALGYSTSGEVIAVADDVNEFKVGDLVACGGASASHADIIAVPKNLCVKLPENIDLKQASFTTIASIAIQGIRQSNLKFGETAVIIGLGLIGQLTTIILRASGINVIGVDLDDQKVLEAIKSGANKAYNRNQEGIDNIILSNTNGFGADAVIITAGTSSHDPVNFAGEIARNKSRVVIVGAVPTGFERKSYYRKELELVMSCSYGPGRYDANYEEKGIDYPVGYIRWTEQRNMQAFIDLLSQKKIDISHLITHTFPLENAAEAYDIILGKTETFTGLVIEYDTLSPKESKIKLSDKKINPSEPNVGLIGAGSFAQNMLLPRMKNRYNFIGVSTARGNTSKYVGDKYNFNFCTNEYNDLVENENINTIFIATRHNLHAEMVKASLLKGKNVFTEKPLCLTETELKEISTIYSKNDSSRLMLGFNRRFSPITQKIKSIFSDDAAKSINMRINAGILPVDHWVHDPEIGGGRIIGEACHFIDLAAYIAGAEITNVYASNCQSNKLVDTVNISLEFSNGSIAQIAYYSNGNKNVPKEYIEIFSAGTTAIIDDFKLLTIFGKKTKKIKLKEQDKGHTNELIAFADSIKKGLPSPIPFSEIYNSTLATFKVLESIREKRKLSF